GADILMEAGSPIFRDSVIDAYFAVRGASPTVEDSEILGHASVDGPGRTVIRRSTLWEGTSASADATGSYEDNLFIGAALVVDTGSDMTVSGNTIRDIVDGEAGIEVVGDGSSAVIVGNTVENAKLGISIEVSDGPESSVVGTTIRDVRVGITVDSDGATRVEGNTITEASNFGIVLEGGQPTVSGNTICASDQAFKVLGGADPDFVSNEVCESREAVEATAQPTEATAQSAGGTLTVAQDGNGDFETISAAIEAAADGDTIFIGPGEYVESLYLDKPLTLSGSAPREDVVVAPDRRESPIRPIEPSPETGPVGIYVDAADVTIEHLTVNTPEFTSIGLIGGTSVVRDVVTNNFLFVRGTASATIEDSDLDVIGLAGPNETLVRNNTMRGLLEASQGSTGRVEGNVVVDHSVIVNSGAHLDIIDNTFQPLDDYAAIEVLEPGTSANVTGNDIEGGWVGVLVEFPESVTIEGNTITGPQVGIVVLEAAVSIRDNTVTDAQEVGIYVAGDGVLVEGNRIEGGRMGMHLEADPGHFPDDRRFLEERTRIEGNTISGASHFGMVIEESRPSVSGNTICAGREPLKIVGDADPQIGTNEICDVE
ncbi:MAG: right-handed parallel beta-helix repeat-containing protein, partial [Actinomycetia bacterium]|nr:right-handed parallel beta-helix repeat-containing protein [Actinomycetes bacterium]